MLTLTHIECAEFSRIMYVPPFFFSKKKLISLVKTRHSFLVFRETMWWTSQIILYMSYLPTKYNGGKRWNHAKVYHLNCVKLSSRIMARCLLFWIACSFSNGHAIKHEYSIDANDHCEMWLLLTDIKTKSGTFLAALHQCANKPTQMETFTAAVAKRTLAFFYVFYMICFCT